MNGRIFKLDIPPHRAVQELLPWYVTAQLNADDTAKVESHLHSCAQCQQDLQWERDLRAGATAGMAAAQPEGVDMERALARLLPQLGAQDVVPETMSAPGPDASRPPANAKTSPANAQMSFPPARESNSANSAAPQRQDNAQHPSTSAPLPWWRRAAANQPSWLRWAAAAQCVIIAGLLVLLARPDAPAEYRAMGAADANPGAASANLVVMFQPDATEHALRAALQAQGARIVDGPTVTDAYLIAVPPSERVRVLQALRSDPAVKMAESIDSGGAQ